MSDIKDKNVSSQQQSAPEQSQSAPQPPYGNTATQPKKKRVRLIVGIISGVVALILVVTALLLYFLWWQNPQKMVTDAVANAITTKKAIVNGKVTVNAGDNGRLELDIKTANDAPKSKTDIAARITVNGVSESVKVNAELVSDGNGTLYIKAKGIKKAITSLVDAVIENQLRASNVAMDTSTEQQADAYKKQIMTQLNPVLAKIDDKWLKISVSDFDEKASECSAKVMSKLQKDDAMRNEIANLYAENSFLIIKDTKVEERNGARGFEIDVNSAESHDKARAFAEAMKDTQFGKELRKCDPGADFKTKRNSAKNSKEDNRGALRIWVDSFSHKLKAVEFKLDDHDQEVTANLTLDIEQDKTEEITVPSSAENLKDVMNEVVKQFSHTTSNSSNISTTDLL